MSLVVCGIRPSVHAACSGFSRGNWRFSDFVYNKINGIEPNISAELVRETKSYGGKQFTSKQICPIGCQATESKFWTATRSLQPNIVFWNCVRSIVHRCWQVASGSRPVLDGSAVDVFPVKMVMRRNVLY